MSNMNTDTPSPSLARVVRAVLRDYYAVGADVVPECVAGDAVAEIGSSDPREYRAALAYIGRLLR